MHLLDELTSLLSLCLCHLLHLVLVDGRFLHLTGLSLVIRLFLDGLSQARHDLNLASDSTHARSGGVWWVFDLSGCLLELVVVELRFEGKVLQRLYWPMHVVDGTQIWLIYKLGRLE